MAEAVLIPVQYARKLYPEWITPRIQEIAGHFDVSDISPSLPYCLHTEYYYSSRRLGTALVRQFKAITGSRKNGIPQLWLSREWSLEFAEFIAGLTAGRRPPDVVEIHPPFDDYCPSIGGFLDNYSVFEERMGELFPDAVICIEHRFGTTYKGGKFLVSGVDDLVKLSLELEKRGLRLKIVLDFIQLFTRHYGKRPRSPRDNDNVVSALAGHTGRISLVHVWGKKRIRGRLVAHQGDLNDYFDHDRPLKEHFLEKARGFLADGVPRYFVPEVNSGKEDIAAIARDFREAGFVFK